MASLEHCLRLYGGLFTPEEKKALRAESRGLATKQKIPFKQAMIQVAGVRRDEAQKEYGKIEEIIKKHVGVVEEEKKPGDWQVVKGGKGVEVMAREGEKAKPEAVPEKEEVMLFDDLSDRAKGAIASDAMGKGQEAERFTKSEWLHKTVDIESLKSKNKSVWSDSFIPRKSETEGPLIVATDGEVLDGNNRLWEAIERKDKQIDILVRGGEKVVVEPEVVGKPEPEVAAKVEKEPAWTAETEKAFNELRRKDVAEKERAKNLSKTKSRLLKNIKSEKGSSELINDLSRLGADAIKRGHKSFKAFSVEMKAILGDAWAKVRHLIRRAYADAKLILANERGLIGGVRAKGAPTGQLAKAQEMLAEGKDKNEIWRETGWMKGVEKGNVWKFEIDDSGAKLFAGAKKTIEEFLNKPGGQSKNILGQVLNHPKLYKAYPEVAKIPIEINVSAIPKSMRTKGTGNSGSFGTTRIAGQRLTADTITVQAENSNIETTVLHEIQHVIQGIEGFAPGGSPETVGYLKSPSQETQKILNQKTKDIQDVQNEYIKLRQKLTLEELLKHPTYKKFDKLQKEIGVLSKEAQSEARYISYESLAGEVEARDTAARAELTPAQRGQNFNKAKNLFKRSQKIRQLDKYKKEEQVWIKSNQKDSDLKKRNESPGHKRLYALEDRVFEMGYDLNQRLVREALLGDKSAQNILIQMPYESQGIPQDQWIVTDGKGTSFSVEVPAEGKKEHPTITPGAQKLLGELEELKKEQKPPKIASSYEQQKDDWFGNKDWAEFRNTVEKNKLQEGIKANVSKTSNIFRKKIFDKKCQDVDRAIHIYLDLKRNPGHLNEFYKKLTKEQQKIVDLAQTIEGNPDLKVLANYIASEYDKIGKMALNAGVIRNVLDNYVARIWKIDNKLTTDVSQKFKTSSRHAKHRIFETILEGQAAGYELQVTGATSNLNVLKDEIARVIEDKKLITEMRKTKRQDGSPLISTHKINDTDKKIEHPNFKVWEFAANVDLAEKEIDKATGLAVGDKVRIGRNKAIGSVVDIGDMEITVSFKVEGTEELKKIPINPEGGLVGVTRVRPEGKNFFITDEGAVLEKRELYASKEIAKDLNKVLGVSKLKGLPGIDTLTKYNAIFKSWILVTSFFHHCAFLRSYYLPSQHKTKAEWNPVKTFKAGKKAINELKPELELLVRNGLTMFKTQDWEEGLLRQEDTIFGKVLDKTMATKAIKDKINNLRERQANFLFGNFGAALKTQAALIELRNMTRKYPDMDVQERAKMVARLINADFGGLHHGRMGRDPTIQHIMRLGLLAPDWTESNIRTMVGAFKAGGAKERAMYRSFWASAITKGLSAVFAANILLAAFDEDDFMERYKKAWEAGRFRWLDIDITPIYKMFGGETEARKYFSLFGHFRDPLKFVIHPIRSLHHKGSVVYGTFHEAMAGTDWRGQRFTTLSELIGVDDKGVYLTTTETHEIGEQKGGKLTGKQTTFKAGRKGPIGFGQVPSYAISQLIGVQPIQIQNFIAMLTGEVAAFDAIARSLGMHTSTTYPKDPSDLYPSENLTKFRKMAREMDVLIRTIDHYKKTGDIEKAVELARASRETLQYKKGVNKVRRRIGLINGRIEMIHYRKDLTPEQKKEKINKLLDYRNKILENAHKVMTTKKEIAGGD